MPWYSAGTIQVAANGTTATGTGTAFIGNVRIGDGITIAGSTALHEVTGVTSNTQLTFQPPYAGSAGSGKAYRIAPVLGYDKDLSDAFNQIRLNWGTQLSSLQPWATAATAAQAREAMGANDAGSLTSGLLNVARIPATLTPDKAFRRGNILGTVSQSGGVPTGAIIERGSNANGEYVRFADGTQICTVRIAIDLSNTSAQNINWPATFTSMVPFSLVIDSSPGVTSSTIYDAFQSIAPMADSTVRGRVVVRTTAPYTIQCLFVAIGRWF